IPFDEILRQGEHFWNATLDSGSTLIGYGRSVIIEDSQGVPIDRMAVVGYIRPDKILTSMTLANVAEIAIVNPQGTVLLHPNADWMWQQRSMSNDELFKVAKDSKVALSVASYKSEKDSFLGGYAKAYQDKVFVLARVPEEKVFSAV